MKWIIEDWMGNECNLNGQTEFASYGDARDAINEFASWLCDQAIENGKYTEDSAEHEAAHDGICEDLYAIPVDENGNHVNAPDEAYQY